MQIKVGPTKVEGWFTKVEEMDPIFRYTYICKWCMPRMHHDRRSFGSRCIISDVRTLGLFMCCECRIRSVCIWIISDGLQLCLKIRCWGISAENRSREEKLGGEVSRSYCCSMNCREVNCRYCIWSIYYTNHKIMIFS